MADTVPMDEPDEKDWTWVLEEVCGECSYDVRYFDRSSIGQLIRENVAEWVGVLEAEPDGLRQRPRVEKWSPLEYGAHIRDVYELYDVRLSLMLEQDAPHFPNWDQDATAVEKNYGAADPAAVAEELVMWGERLATRFDSVSGETWTRTGFRSDGAAFTVESFARYLIHDPMHHLRDVRTR